MQEQEVACGGRRPLSDGPDQRLQSGGVLRPDPAAQFVHLFEVRSELLQGDEQREKFTAKTIYPSIYLLYIVHLYIHLIYIVFILYCIIYSYLFLNYTSSILYYFFPFVLLLL